MSLVALFSDKGSPGVTTLAFALAAAWPRPNVLVELDPAGGDLHLRLTDRAGHPALTTEPGLLTLATAARRGADLRAHAQTAGTGTLVVPGLANSRQAKGMTELWPHVANSVRATADCVDVFADLGRLDWQSPVAEVAQTADVVVGVARAEPSGMLRLRDRLHELDDHNPACLAVAVVVAEDRRGREAGEAMRRVLDTCADPISFVAVVSIDGRAVAALHSGGRASTRSAFFRSVAAMVPLLSGAPAPISSTRPLVSR